MTFKGKDGSTSVLQDLTNGLAQMDAEGDVRWTRTDDSKGQLLTTAAEVGAKDTGSNNYQ